MHSKMMAFIIPLVLAFNIYATEVTQVTILADDSYPPYSFVENGKLKGIYIDIVRQAATLIESHYKINIIAIPWKRGLLEIEMGKSFALIPPYKHIQKRSYIWPYSIPLMKEHVVAFCQKGINLSKYINPTKIKKQPPLMIGINAGYLILNKKLEKAVHRKDIIISENKSTSSNIMKLYTKRLDCYFNDKNSTHWELSQLSKKSSINFENVREALLVMTQTAHIGYTNAHGHDFEFKDDFVLRMDDALSNLISSGTYQEIINQYVDIK
jgi:polar amino acid transport system substrate-binding protein